MPGLGRGPPGPAGPVGRAPGRCGAAPGAAGRVAVEPPTPNGLLAMRGPGRGPAAPGASGATGEAVAEAAAGIGAGAAGAAGAGGAAAGAATEAATGAAIAAAGVSTGTAGAGAGAGAAAGGAGAAGGCCGLLRGRLLCRRASTGVRERLSEFAGDWCLNGGGRRLYVLTHLGEFGENILAGDSELFSERGDAGLACHVTPSKWSGGIPRRPARRWTYSLLGLHRVPIDLQLLRGSAVGSPCSAATYSRTGDGSIGTGLRRARAKARRR
jgi:hypothetical protein